MAMWMMHLRIADNLLNYGFEIEPQPFYAGNIAPDVPLPDDPQKYKSHFRDDLNRHIQPEDFYNLYLRDKKHNPQITAFLLGYYAHLLADVEWVGNVWRPFKRNFPDISRRMETDGKFAYEFKQLQFFGHDMIYLDENSGYPALEMLKSIKTLTTGLDQLPPEAIRAFLSEEVFSLYEDDNLMQRARRHDFPYLNRTDIDGWIDCTTGVLIELFKAKGIRCSNPRPLWGEYIQPYA